AYLTSSFRIRLGKQNFQSSDETAWIDNLKVQCVSQQSCTGTPYSCSFYSSQGTCETCGCSWTSTAWNWNIGGVNTGYQNYEQCEWYD
ncbi:MAG: hypothetical protein JW791_01090, partial [Nanoarchaeota archaeon]|nr:hypothetical protein [Nanoarchaeota archaeon]